MQTHIEEMHPIERLATWSWGAMAEDIAMEMTTVEQQEQWERISLQFFGMQRLSQLTGDDSGAALAKEIAKQANARKSAAFWEALANE